jgi:hypothetical protein
MLATATAGRQGQHSRFRNAGLMTEDHAVPAADRAAQHTADLAALAWQAWAAGDAGAARPLSCAATAAARGRPRRERQLAQIVQLTVDGDTGRASGLTAEHLAEFPDDQLIGRVQAWMSDRRRGWPGSAEPDGR